MNRPLGYALLAAGMAVVGTYVALAKPLTGALPVFLLAWLRFAIAAVAMLPWTFGAGTARVAPNEWRALFLQSFFGNFLFSIFMLYGVSMTSASAAGVILATLPAVVAVLSWLVLRERLTARALLAIALAVCGVAVLTIGRGLGAGGVQSVLGNLLVFGCVCCEAVYVVIGKRLTATLSAMRISALINLFGLALMTPFGLWQAIDFPFASLSAGVWALLVFYALAASVFSTWLWLSGLKLVPASHSGVFTIAMPMAASIVAVAFLGERFTAVHALAFALAVAGVLLITWPARRSADARRAPPA
jgi:drug/metabolite transporter (DMT)-like permease